MRILALLAMSLLTSVATEGRAQELYLGATGHYFMPDHDRTSAKGAGGGLYIGFPIGIFSGSASVELGAFGSSVSAEGTVPKYSVSGGELLLRGMLAEGQAGSSFVLLGGGAAHNTEFKDDSTGFFTSGLGFLVPLGDRGWYLRGEGRMYVQKTEPPATGPQEDLLFDYRAALGLEYSFADAAYTPARVEKPARAAPAAPSYAPVPIPLAPADGDSDGVPDTADRCPGTAPGGAVDPAGCAVIVTADADRDGVLDNADRCANTPPDAAVDMSGCALLLDADSDGIVDSRDRCPETPVGSSVDFQGCPPPVADADGDGVPDKADRCPGTAKGVTVDVRGCLPSNDSDRDGVPNATDLCPDTPPRMRVDGDGCVVQQSVSFSSITFQLNSSLLTTNAMTVLDLVADGLKSQPGLSVTIAGHTDSTGSTALNLALSRARAKAVQTYLVASGVAAGRLHTEGHGASRPVASNNSESGRAQNRRVEFNIRR